MEWSVSYFILSTVFVSAGALLQAATGLGAGLIIVPLLALLSYELIPGPMIFASLVLTASMAFSGRLHINYSGTRVLFSGLLIGTVIAAYSVAILPMQNLGLLFGLLILFAVGISMLSPRFTLNTKGYIGAGVLSGFLGTSAGIGAPILALLYQHQTGPTIRATLAFLYFVSSIIMLFFLSLAGKFGNKEIISGFYLIPGFVLGYFLSPKLARYVDRGYARRAVLWISTVSAVMLIWRSI